MIIIAKKMIGLTRQLWLAAPANPVQHVFTVQKAIGIELQSRRSFGLQSVGLAAMVGASMLYYPSANAQPGKTTGRSIAVAQMVDFSNAHQDVSKDFLIGSRAAWQDINSHGGVKGKQVNHITYELDGSAAGLQTSLEAVRTNLDCIAVFGTASDPMAIAVSNALHNSATPVAHIAPWLHSAGADASRNTFSIFASSQDQISHALKSLTGLGVQSIAVVFATVADMRQNQADIVRIGQALGLGTQIHPFNANLRMAGQLISSSTPAVILFVGGTPELAQFTQGLEKQARQRYIVALADVNLQTLQQMGAGKNTPVIATQPVPMVNASLPVVRKYREIMARLYDEPLSSLSLAGFISARYTFEVISAVNGPLSRASVLEALMRRKDTDIGGFRVAVGNKVGSSYVTQSMLAQDGRVIG